MSQESPPKETLQEINPSNIFEKMEENKLQTEVQENQENQESQNYLNIYQSFPLNPLEQILINKIIPYGYKLETEENLLKTDDKKKKGYLHRKHKRNSATSILENIVDNENNIDINNSNISNNNINNNNNNIEKIQKPRRRKKSSSSHNTEFFAFLSYLFHKFYSPL